MSRFDPNFFVANSDQCGFASLELFTCILHDSVNRVSECGLNPPHCNGCGYICGECYSRKRQFRDCVVLVAGVVLGKEAVLSGEEREYWLGIAGVDSVELGLKDTPLELLEELHEVMGIACRHLRQLFEFAVDEDRHRDCHEHRYSSDWHEYLYAVAEVGLAQRVLSDLIAQHAAYGDGARAKELVGMDGIDEWLDGQSFKWAVTYGFRWVDRATSELMENVGTSGQIDRMHQLMMMCRSLAHIERTFVELRVAGDSSWCVEREDGKAVLRNRPPNFEVGTVRFVIGLVYRLAIRCTSMVSDAYGRFANQSVKADVRDMEDSDSVDPSFSEDMLVSSFVMLYCDIRCELARLLELTGASAAELRALADEPSNSELVDVFGQSAPSVRRFLSWFDGDVLELGQHLVAWIDRQYVDTAIDGVFRSLNSSDRDEESGYAWKGLQRLEILKFELNAIELVARVSSARRCSVPGMGAIASEPHLARASTRAHRRVSEWTQSFGFHAAVTHLSMHILNLCVTSFEMGTSKFNSTPLLPLLVNAVKVLEVVHRSHTLILRDERG